MKEGNGGRREQWEGEGKGQARKEPFIFSSRTLFYVI